MKYLVILSLVTLLISCGKDIASAIASDTNSKTAPWRISRTEAQFMASTVEKDAVCKNEFGDSYMMGTSEEARGLGVIVSSNASSADGVERRSTSPSVYNANNINAVGTAPVFCIKE